MVKLIKNYRQKLKIRIPFNRPNQNAKKFNKINSKSSIQANELHKNPSKATKKVVSYNICNKCGKCYSLKKNLNRHERESHLKSSLKRCPYCFRVYPRIKDHLLRCKDGIFTKLYAISEKEKIYKKRKENGQCSAPPKITQLRKGLSNTYIRYINHFSKIEEQYKCIKGTIGEGSFSKVYIGININTNIPVAIKYLKEEKAKITLFNREVNFLKEFQNEYCFPRVLYSEFSKENKIIVQSLLGPNLHELLSLCGGKFPLNTILNFFSHKNLHIVWLFVLML